MNKKEILILAVGVFLTIVAWMLIDIYHITDSKYINREIQPVHVSTFKIDTSIFQKLSAKTP